MKFQHIRYANYVSRWADFYALDDPLKPDGPKHIVLGGQIRATSGLVSVIKVIVE